MASVRPAPGPGCSDKANETCGGQDRGGHQRPHGGADGWAEE